MSKIDAEKKKIEEEIAKSQVRLSETTTAINRENLILEQLSKSKTILVKEVASLEQKLADLSVDIANTKDKLSKQQEKEKEHNAIFLKEKTSLNAELDSLKLAIKKYNEDIEQKHLDAKIKLDLLVQESEKERKSIRESVILMTIQLDKQKEHMSALKSDIDSLESKKIAILDLIKDISISKESSIKELDTLESKIVSSNTKLSNLSKDITEKEHILSTLEQSIINEESTFKELNNRNKDLNNEIQELESTKSEYIKAKMALQKDKEDLINRELFIKEKYEQAGITY